MELLDREIEMLSNEHPALLKLYIFLKSKMKISNFISSGFLYSDIQNFMSVPSKKGKTSIIFSRHQIRYLLNQLIECGLIVQRRDIDNFYFELVVPKLCTDLLTHYRNDTKSYQQENTHTFAPTFEHTYPQENENNYMNNNENLEDAQSKLAHRFTHRFAQASFNVYELTKWTNFIGNKIIFNNYHFVQSECIYNNIIHIKKYINNNININNNKYVLFSFGTFLFSVNFPREEVNCTVDKVNINDKKLSKDIFDEFWKLYPRKVGKQKCLRKFIALCKESEGVDKLILEGLKRYLPLYEMKDKEFIPHPYTWLNQGRWEDDIESQQRKYF
jgi:hypothetical protein